MINLISCENEKIAHSKLLFLPKINKDFGVEEVIENGHIIDLKIKWLDLTKNMDVLCNFEMLENLEIHNCKISPLTEEFSKLVNLKSLTISFFDTYENIRLEEDVKEKNCVENTLKNALTEHEISLAFFSLSMASRSEDFELKMKSTLKHLFDIIKSRLNGDSEEEINRDIKADYLFPILFFVPNLKEITLEKILIDAEMGDALGCFIDLGKLHLNHCGLINFPGWVNNLKELTELSLAGNSFIDVSGKLFDLPLLEYFFINNRFWRIDKIEH